MRHRSSLSQLEAPRRKGQRRAKQDQKQTANREWRRGRRGAIDLRGAHCRWQLVVAGERASGPVSCAGLVGGHQRLDHRRGRLLVPRGVPLQQPRQAHDLAVLALLLPRLGRRRGVALPAQLQQQETENKCIQRVISKREFTVNCLHFERAEIPVEVKGHGTRGHGRPRALALGTVGARGHDVTGIAYNFSFLGTLNTSCE